MAETSRRVRAANLMNEILRDLGSLTAIVPRGPLRDQVDDEVSHMAALAEAIGAESATWDSHEQ